MSNNRLIPILESVRDKDGNPAYCCIKQWLIVHRRVRTGALADAWGMAKSSVRYWRRKQKLGQLECEHKLTCKIYAQNQEQISG